MITYEQAEKENDAMVTNALAQSTDEIFHQASVWASCKESTLAVVALHPMLSVERVYDSFHDQFLSLVSTT